MYQRDYGNRRNANRQKQNKNYLVILGIFVIIFFGLLVLHNQKNPTVKQIKITPYLTTHNSQLYFHGKPYTAIGYTSFNVDSMPGHNEGCGGYVTNLDPLFSTLRQGGLIRVWAMQGSMAINPKTRKLDWTGIDRVLNSAQKYHQLVILTLGNQSGQCDDELWKGSTWYTGGYKQIYNPSGFTPISYMNYVKQIVSRYKNSKVVGMWELMNEPETSDCTGYSGAACYGHQTCNDHAQAAKDLRQFYDTVGGMVKSIDPNHLIEDGLTGSGQCGSDDYNYSYVNQSPYINVASYHDYNEDNTPLPGDQWNGLNERINQMASLKKPLIVGEVGILASKNGGSCVTPDTRQALIAAKVNAMFSHGVSAILLWNRTIANPTSCNYDIGNSDPLIKYLNTYALPN